MVRCFTATRASAGVVACAGRPSTRACVDRAQTLYRREWSRGRANQRVVLRHRAVTLAATGTWLARASHSSSPTGEAPVADSRGSPPRAAGGFRAPTTASRNPCARARPATSSCRETDRAVESRGARGATACGFDHEHRRAQEPKATNSLLAHSSHLHRTRRSVPPVRICIRLIGVDPGRCHANGSIADERWLGVIVETDASCGGRWLGRRDEVYLAHPAARLDPDPALRAAIDRWFRLDRLRASVAFDDADPPRRRRCFRADRAIRGEAQTEGASSRSRVAPSTTPASVGRRLSRSRSRSRFGDVTGRAHATRQTNTRLGITSRVSHEAPDYSSSEDPAVVGGRWFLAPHDLLRWQSIRPGQ